MIRGHKFYEMQSALAALGQLSEAELLELEEHANDCVSCHEYIADMAEVSREFFLLQSGKVSGKGMPAGMQERFLARAVHAGILIGRPASAGFNLRFAQTSVIALLLIVFLSLSGKMFSIPGAESVAMQDVPAPVIRFNQALEAVSVPAREHTVHGVSEGSAQSRRRPIARQRAVSIPSTRGISRDRQPDLDLSRPFFAAQGLPANFSDRKTLWDDTMPERYRTAGMHSPKPSSFTKEYVARFFGREVDTKPDEHAFHYDLKLASLSLQESSLDAYSRQLAHGMKFNAPALQFDSHRTW
jgi:hypothetical protein